MKNMGSPVESSEGRVPLPQTLAKAIAATLIRKICRQSRGSRYELRDHLTAALDAGYIRQEKYEELEAMAISAMKLVHGYSRATRNLKAAAEDELS
jgi:hypothetical protein